MPPSRPRPRRAVLLESAHPASDPRRLRAALDEELAGTAPGEEPGEA